MTARRGLFTAVEADGTTGTTPQDARLALAGVLPVLGVLNGLAVTGSSSGPNMQYTVSAGTAVAARGAVTSDGVYLIGNDGPFTRDSTAPAPASGSRWDIIWIRPRNTIDGFGDPSSLPDIGVTVGVASGTPTKPYAAGSGAGGTSVPAGALVLAESLVGTNAANAAAATITRVAKPTSPRGGITKTAGTSEYPTNPTVGDHIDDANLGGLLRWMGTKWQPYSKGPDIDDQGTSGSVRIGSLLIQWGRRTINGTGGATATSAFNFPIPFSVIPELTATAQGGSIYIASVNVISATGATLVIRDRNDTNISGSTNVSWIAIGLA